MGQTMHSKEISRREFLKWASLAAAGFVMVELPSAGNIPLPIQKKLKENPLKPEYQGTQTELPKTPPPEATPEKPLKIFETLFKPFVKEAQKRRKKRAENDPEYFQRVDQELNSYRINFLLFAFGETHEPPLTEWAIIGSQTIVSFDLRTSKLDFVSITHDTRAPEIEQYQREHGVIVKSAIKIDKAYEVGGFPLMAKTLENATGLSVDFQIVLPEIVIKDFIDSVFGEVEINIPYNLVTNPYYLKGKKYPGKTFWQGRQKLTGQEVIQFIKTVPVETEKTYDKQKEHNRRKHLVFAALARETEENLINSFFLPKVLKFLIEERPRDRVKYNFDIQAFLMDTLGTVIEDIGKSLIKKRTIQTSLPQRGEELYLVDAKHGDSGLRWVGGSKNPIFQRELQEGFYPDKAVAVPLGEKANPYARDLATYYWGSTRRLVKQSLAKGRRDDEE